MRNGFGVAFFNLLAVISVSAAPPASPVSPEEALGLFELDPACRIELAAAEPDVIDPVHVAFDPEGRMWVVEYSDYPNGPAEGEPGKSRIRVLSDADGDGRFGQPITFADKLLFANGLLHWKDGVIVTTNGAVLFLRDTDGDLQCDVTEEWFKGFARENPQLRANHPTLGSDGYVYIASGLRGGEVGPGNDWPGNRANPSGGEKPDPAPVSLSGRDFRFDPRSGAYEAVSGVGQFGLSFDDWGNRFVCSNRNPCDQIVLEDWYVRRNPNVPIAAVKQVVSPAAEQSRVYASSRTWTTSNLHAGQFTAACGLCLYRGDGLPADFLGNSFACEPTANLVHRDILEPQGATFRARYAYEETEFLRSTDEWFRPVNLAVGPDGALYLSDMYRAVIEHPQFMPEELKTRPDLVLGNDRGRVYRIVRKDAPPHDARRMTVDRGELPSLLSHPNGWQRETAARLLLEDESPQSIEALRLVATTSDSPQGRFLALSLLQAKQELGDVAILQGLADPHPRVVEQCVRFGESRQNDQIEGKIRQLAADRSDSRLQFQAILSLSMLRPSPREAGLLAEAALAAPSDAWLQSAVKIAALDPAPVLGQLLERTAAAPPDEQAAIMPLLTEFAELSAASRGAAAMEGLISAVLQRDKPMRWAMLTGFGRGLRRKSLRLSEVLEKLPEELRTKSLAEFQEAAQRMATPPEDGGEAVGFGEGLALLEFAGWDDAKSLLTVAGSRADQEVRLAAVEVLGRRGDQEIGPALVALYSSQTPTVRRAILEASCRSASGVAALLTELEAGAISPLEIDPARANQLRVHKDAELRARAVKILAAAAPADRRQVLKEYEPALTAKGDPARGREMFARNCVQCHKIGDLGVNVAPDISDSRTKTPAQLLQAILDPNAAIDNNYFSFTILDTDGVVHTGVIAAETASSVTLKQPEGKTTTLLRQDIDELKSNGVSLMPAGLEKNLTVAQMADLISFIKNWRYLDGSVPEEVIR